MIDRYHNSLLIFKHWPLNITKACNLECKQSASNFVYPAVDGLLRVGVCCKSLASQLVLKEFRDWKLHRRRYCHVRCIGNRCPVIYVQHLYSKLQEEAEEEKEED